MKKTAIILFFILSLQLLLRLPFLAEPLTQDEGIYSCVAARMAQGDVLYRDLVDTKPPGVFYIYLFIYKLLGWSAFALRRATALFALLPTIVLFFIGRKLRDEKTGLTAALFYALFAGGVLVEGAGSNTEVFMVLPLLLALYFFLAGNIFMAGLFSGLAPLIKQVAVFNLLALFGFSFIRGRQWDLKRAGVYLAGCAVPPLLIVTYFWSKGGLAGFIDCNLFYSLGMVNPSIGYFFFKTLYIMLFENSVLWVMAGVGVWSIMSSKVKGNGGLLLVWVLLSLVGVFSAGYSFGHYYLQLIPGLSLLAGIGVASWSGSRLSLIGRRVLLAVSGVLILLIIASQYEFYLVYSPDEISFQRYGTPANAIARRLGERLKDITLPRDRIFTKSLYSAVLYAGRIPAGTNYLTVRGGIGEISFFGRRIFSRPFFIKRSPALMQLINDDFDRSLADYRTKYFIVYLRDYYAPGDIKQKLNKYDYRFDRELSDIKNEVLVFGRKQKAER